MVEFADVTIGVLGGTGAQGRALAFRFAAAGRTVTVGSRDPGRAGAAADRINATLVGGTQVRGESNAEACSAGVVIAAVPFDGHAELLESLRARLVGRILVDCVNPVAFDKRGAYDVPVADGSAAEQAAAILPGTTVVAAFHHVSAVLLADPAVASVDCDVLVLGDDRDATDLVQALAALIPGMRGVYAGRLRNAGQVEALTANLLSTNRRYHAHAGIRITGIAAS